MELGAFSTSLAVKDLAASKQFYEKLGFETVGGDEGQKYLIMRNGENSIGLFEGMFDKNIMTFNPGWDANCNDLEKFADVRDIQAAFKQAGITLATEADPNSQGPASISLLDPDGNAILIDQHR